MRVRMLAAVAGVWVMLASGSVLADIPPDPDYVEECSAENYNRGGAQCVTCSANYTNPDACAQDREPDFQKRCKTAGASNWQEVWCKGGDPNLAPEKSGSCGACSVGERVDLEASGLGFALLLVLGVWRKRRADG